MTGKTHAAVGLGTVLAVTQPSTVSGLVLAAGTGMLGALISDIDVGTSKSHKDADRITLIAVLLVAAEIALNYFYCSLRLWKKSAAPVIYAFDHGYGYFERSAFYGICTAGTLFCGGICVPSGTGLF